MPGRRTSACRHRRSGFKLLLKVNQLLDSIKHVLNTLNLRQAKAPLVGDVINASSSLRMLSMDAAGLDVMLLANSLEFGLGTCKRNLDVYARSHTSSKVGGA